MKAATTPHFNIATSLFQLKVAGKSRQLLGFLAVQED
jgi:hypothetical protein